MTAARDQPLATPSAPYRPGESDYEYTGGGGGVGWVDFAAVMLGLAGTWNILTGILAIGDSRVFVGEELFVFSNLNTWGWIMLLFGAAQVFAAVAVVKGSEFARWFGVGAAALNAIAQLHFVSAYPIWSIALFTIDILIIYGLVAYGGKRLREVVPL